MSDTVEITMSIITDMGSSMMPISKCRLPLKNGSQLILYGTMVSNTPSAVRGRVKYW